MIDAALVQHSDVIALAEALGVQVRFRDWQGNDHPVAAATIVGVLAALGVDAATPEDAAAALQEHRLREWRSVLPACTVLRRGRTGVVLAHVPDPAGVRAWIELESESSTALARAAIPAPIPVVVGPIRRHREVDGRDVAELALEIPDSLPLGWHTLVLEMADPAAAASAAPAGRALSASLVVTPNVLEIPECAARRSWGWLIQLYQVRSRRSWGIGDLGDLADLLAWSGAELGADFVLVNPLPASWPVAPLEPSPYLPTTRRFTNPLYLRIEQIPEYAQLDAADRAEIERIGNAARSSSVELLDRDTTWTAKLAALELLVRVELTDDRATDLAAFCEREGVDLDDFAVWSAFVEAHGSRWRDWPLGLRDRRAEDVAAEAARLADRVELFRRAQWWIDAQLANAQAAARAVGMGVGVLHDLAVGVHPDGFDTWHLRDVLAEGIRVGAPPDAYNQQGQDWLQPPFRPDALARAGYVPYRDMLRAVLRHGGGVRIDHVAGLFRLWWFPAGGNPADGTYVRYDHEAMVGILALEAQRAGAVVVGEDLGTVEPWVRRYLADRGVAGTSVLWFELDEDGLPLPPELWPELRLASVTTHDLPPTAGLLAGEHVRLRAELDLLTQPLEVEAAHAEAQRTAWMEALTARGLLPPDADTAATVEALYRYLAATSSRWLGVSLVDAVGDVRAQNQPGTSDSYPNWRVPLAGPDGHPLILDDLLDDEWIRALARTVSGVQSSAQSGKQSSARSGKQPARTSDAKSGPQPRSRPDGRGR